MGARLGCLVSGAGYRNPSLLVKMATSLDHLSGGRAALGLGAGWSKREHRALGFAYLPVRDRLDRLEEAAGICRGLLDGETRTLPIVARYADWWSADGVARALAMLRDAAVEEVMFDWPAPFDPETLEALAGPVRDRLAAG